MSDPIIRTQDLVREYRTGGKPLRALDGVSLSIQQGEMLSVVGRSGSGKSTLMNILGGLDRPTSGTAHVAGQDLGDLSPRGLARYRSEVVGFVFQSFNLMPRYQAWENVALPLVFNGTDQQTRRRRAEELLERVGLRGRSEHTPAEMSGGEQQRVAVARALVAKPRVLLCDEPTGNLDSANAELIMDLICEVHRDEGTTVLVVTHDAHLAQSRTNRVIQMSDGRVLADELVQPTLSTE